MKKKSMTALICTYVKAYHNRMTRDPLFKDTISEKLLTDDEYQNISHHMTQGIQFFNPNFSGSQEEALDWIVNKQIGPSPIGRSVYLNKILENELNLGLEQCIILACGYDTLSLALGDKEITVLELDTDIMIQDKLKRITQSNITIPSNNYYIASDLSEKTWHLDISNHPKFKDHHKSLVSLLGISYYLTQEDFAHLLKTIATLIPQGSTLVFDYPDDLTFTPLAGERTKKQVLMAAQTGETMKASYSYDDMEKLLSDAGFLIYEHLNPDQINQMIFSNQTDSSLSAFDNVNYCLAVKKS